MSDGELIGPSPRLLATDADDGTGTAAAETAQTALLDAVTAGRGADVWQIRLLLGPVPGGAVSGPVAIVLHPGNLVITTAADGSPAPFRVRSVSAPAVVGRGPVVAVDVALEATASLAQDGQVLHLYRLTLRAVPQINPQFDSAFFLLDIDQSSPVESGESAPEDAALTAAIDYLAKDYTELRQMILGRLALLIPQWQGKNAADIGIMLVEVLAYVGDYLSYYQDAVATETYLSTARRRISVRRHARLLGYRVRSGYNSRVWVHIAVSAVLELPGGTPLVAEGGEIPAVILVADLEQEIGRKAKFFETLEPIQLRPELNRIEIYTWGLEDYTLERGALQATLVDQSAGDDLDAEARRLEKLRVGDVLIFEQVLDPLTGQPGSGLKRLRHAVRLTAVRYSPPLLGDRWIEVSWAAEDALPFDLVVSIRQPQRQIVRAAAALGNIVPADSGITLESVLPPVPGDVPYEPLLPTRKLVHAAPWNAHVERGRPAAEALRQRASDAVPCALLVEEGFPRNRQPPWRDLRPPESLPMTGSQPLPVVPEQLLEHAYAVWAPKLDLLRSPPTAQDFVVETENDGTPMLRFGDGTLGRRPVPGHRFRALFREGHLSGSQIDGDPDHNDAARGGAVGSDAIRSLAAPDLKRYEPWNEIITEVRNPLPSSSDMAPEPLDRVRALAPSDYQIQRSALTVDDWVGIAECQPEVARAAARSFFGGTWSMVVVRVLRAGDLPTDQAFLDRTAARLQTALVAGRSLSVQAPLWVGLQIAVAIELESGYFPDHVTAELRSVFSDRAYFDPRRWSFGATIYASAVLARTFQVEGVSDVRIRRFRRLGKPPPSPLLKSRPTPRRSAPGPTQLPDPAEIALGFGELPRVSSDPARWQTGGIRFEVMKTPATGGSP